MTTKTRTFLLLMLFFMAAPATAQITVFPECNFLGKAVTLPVGNYSRADLIRRGVGDNAMSSIIVSEGFTATIYEKDRFRGRRGIVETLSQCLENDGFNDNVSSLTVEAVGGSTTAALVPGTDDRVQVYTECNYRGRSATLDPGEYTAEHLRQLGIADNSISSIRVPRGLELELYVNDFYRGRSAKLAADDECIVQRFNDVISSLVVSGEVESTDNIDQEVAGNPVIIYSECDYRGQYAQLPVGEYSAGDLKKLGFADNTIASFRVPEGVEFHVFANDFQRGSSSAVSDNVRCLRGSRFDAQISSVNVKEEEWANTSSTSSSMGQNQLGATVTAYTDCNFRGKSASLPPGEYKVKDLQRLGIADYSLSALRIPEGFRVKVYDHDFFRGGTLSLLTTESCLADKRADNAVSSMIVEEVVPEAPEPLVMSSLDRQQLNEGLSCVQKYVEKDLCTSDAWSVLSNFCQLDAIPLMSDGYLEGHVGKGNCTARNWKELVRRISDPDVR